MHRVQDIIKAAVVLMAVVFAFWCAVFIGENSVRPDGMTMRSSVQYLPADDQGQVTRSSKRLDAAYSDAPIYRSTIEEGGSRVAFLIPFDIIESGDDLAFYLGATPGLQEIKLNGQVIQPNIPLDTLRGASDGKALYYMLPSSLVRQGRNEIQVIVEPQSSILALATFHIGAASEAARAASMVELITYNIPTIAISFLIFATLLCFVTNWPSEDRSRILSLMVLMSLWAARTYFITFQTPFEVPFLITSFIYYVLEGSIIIAFARHLLAGEAGSLRWSRALGWTWIALIAYLAMITAAGFVVGPAIREWFKAFAYLASILLLVLAISGLSALAWGVATRRDGRWLERLALMFCLLALSVDAADSAFDLSLPFVNLPLTFYAAAPTGLLLGLGVVASIAREASEARRTVIKSNEILAIRLETQNAELVRSYDAQKQMLGRQIMLEERQRIVRDMHDGIGGQLLGLMMQVRQGGVDKVEIEQGLQSSIADLRLIVDSMDSAEDGLAETLRSFEHRVRAQLEAAGLALKFHHGISEGIDLGARPTLQVLRILQEAVTNAMRHSGASEIDVSGEACADGAVLILISDNGRGLPKPLRRGRGLTSMETRAQNLGGVLSIDTSGCGTTLRLTIPARDMSLDKHPN